MTWSPRSGAAMRARSRSCSPATGPDPRLRERDLERLATARRTSPRRYSSPPCAVCAPPSGRSRSSRGSTRSPRTPASTSCAEPGATSRFPSTSIRNGRRATAICRPGTRSRGRDREQTAARGPARRLPRRIRASPPHPRPARARGPLLSRDRRAPRDVAAGRREHAVPGPAPAGRGIRGADQRAPLRAHSRAHRRLAGESDPAPRRPRTAPAGAPSGALPALPAPRACSRAAPSRWRRTQPGRSQPPEPSRAGPSPRACRRAAPARTPASVPQPVGYWAHSGRGAAW